MANLNADGVYEVNVKATQTKVDLKAIATQELALVSVDGNENTRGSNTKQIDLSTVTTKEITITVTSISGIQKQYTVKIHRQSAITGKVITQAKDQNNQSAQIIVYNSKDTRKEDDKEDPRKIIQDIIINKDGTFSIDLEPDEYDIVIKKTSYLEYRLTNIVVNDGENITIADINIYAGDIVKTDEIELDDLTSLNDNIGVIITDENKEEKSIYDLNEDGVINKEDRNILKENYTKKAEILQWVNPNKTSDFILPIKCSYTITSEYGTRTHPVTGITKNIQELI